MRIFFLALLSLGCLTNTAAAKLFQNSYLEFQIPDSWTCAREKTEWICKDPNDRNLFFILTAKQKNSSESLENFQAALLAPRKRASQTGQTVESQVSNVKKISINEHDWIQALHFQSEVDNYYTLYLATTTDDLSVLVTMSASKDTYEKSSSLLQQSIYSIRLLTPKLESSDENLELANSPLKLLTQKLGLPSGSKIPYIGLAIVIALILGLVFLRK